MKSLSKQPPLFFPPTSTGEKRPHQIEIMDFAVISHHFLYSQTELEDISEGEGEQSTVQDCFIRLLLHVGVIQSRLIVYLVERVSNMTRMEQENE